MKQTGGEQSRHAGRRATTRDMAFAPTRVPDNLRLTARGACSLAAGINDDISRNVAMRNESLRAAGRTATR